MNWNDYRRKDGSIDLAAAYTAIEAVDPTCPSINVKAMFYLADVEGLCKIDSRQVAALALAMAMSISGGEE